jgi:hypothetical protein
MFLERRIERWLGDAAGVVRDRRRGDRGDHFEEVVLAEPGREESDRDAESGRSRSSPTHFKRHLVPLKVSQCSLLTLERFYFLGG